MKDRLAYCFITLVLPCVKFCQFAVLLFDYNLPSPAWEPQWTPPSRWVRRHSCQTGQLPRPSPDGMCRILSYIYTFSVGFYWLETVFTHYFVVVSGRVERLECSWCNGANSLNNLYKFSLFNVMFKKLIIDFQLSMFSFHTSLSSVISKFNSFLLTGFYMQEKVKKQNRGKYRF